MADPWAIAGAIGGGAAAGLAFATLVYMILRDRAGDVPVFSADATERSDIAGVYRLNLHVRRLSAEPAWKLEKVSVTPRFRVVRLENYEEFPAAPPWSDHFTIDRMVQVGVPSPITQGSCFLRCLGGSRRCKLRVELARPTGQQRTLKVPVRL